MSSLSFYSRIVIILEQELLIVSILLDALKLHLSARIKDKLRSFILVLTQISVHSLGTLVVLVWEPTTRIDFISLSGVRERCIRLLLICHLRARRRSHEARDLGIQHVGVHVLKNPLLSLGFKVH